MDHHFSRECTGGGGITGSVPQQYQNDIPNLLFGCPTEVHQVTSRKSKGLTDRGFTYSS